MASSLSIDSTKEPHENYSPYLALGLSALQARPVAKIVSGTLVLADRQGLEHPGRLARALLIGPGTTGSWVDLDDQGHFIIPIPDSLSGPFRVRLSLDNRYWAFHNPNGNVRYEWETSDIAIPVGAGADVGVVRPVAGSENSKLAVLHLTYLDALDFLAREGDASWWKNTLKINWPSTANFFSPWAWSLDLTDATHWDVVLHELGHAVQAGAMHARSAGGQHKIDECYSAALAWSRGGPASLPRR